LPTTLTQSGVLHFDRHELTPNPLFLIHLTPTPLPGERGQLPDNVFLNPFSFKRRGQGNEARVADYGNKRGRVYGIMSRDTSSTTL